MACGGLYILFNFYATQIEHKLIQDKKIQIHQWDVGVIGNIVVGSVQNNVKLYARFLQNTPMAIHLSNNNVHKLIKHGAPVVCFLAILSIDQMYCRIV